MRAYYCGYLTLAGLAASTL